MLIGGRAHSLEEANFVGEAQLDFAEINLLNPHHASQEITSLLAIKEKFNFFFLVHGPEEGSPFDCQELRATWLPHIKALLDFADKLNANLVTLHFWLDQRFLDKTVLEKKLSILEELIGCAIKKNITLCLENLSERTQDFEPAFTRFPELGLTLDIGHGELLTSQNTAYDFAGTYPDRISHVHIHDNKGGDTPQDDLHLPLGSGTINFKPIVSALCKTGYDKTITLEVFPPFLKEGKEKLKTLLSACSKV